MKRQTDVKIDILKYLYITLIQLNMNVNASYFILIIYIIIIYNFILIIYVIIIYVIII